MAKKLQKSEDIPLTNTAFDKEYAKVKKVIERNKVINWFKSCEVVDNSVTIIYSESLVNSQLKKLLQIADDFEMDLELTARKKGKEIEILVFISY